MSPAAITKSLGGLISLLVTSAVVMALLVIGFYSDNFLKQNFLDNTRRQMQHSFQRLSDNLLTVEKQLRGGVGFANNETLIASIDLINTYQDKDDYNTFLIDEEKKTVAQKLLEQLKLTFNSSIALYDINGDLQEYVLQTDKGYQLNYITFDSGEMQILSRLEHERTYFNLEQRLPQLISPVVQGSDLDKGLSSAKPPFTYQQNNKSLCITLHQNIIEDGTPIAHLVITRILDEKYFGAISRDFGLEISFSMDPQYHPESASITKGGEPPSLTVTEGENGYRSVMVRESGSGPIFFIAEDDNRQQNKVLKANRIQLLLLLAVIAVVILVLMRILIHRTIARPLKTVMDQIEKIGRQDYSTAEEVTTGNELETISKSINSVTTVIKEREEQLLASANQVRSLVETLPDLIWQKDAAGRFVLCNSKVERLYGARESELIGKTDYDFLTGELADSFLEEDQGAIAAGRPCAFEKKLTFADDGHHEITETIKMPMFSGEGELVGLLGIGRNITDRKRAEETLRRSQKMDAIGQLTGGIAHDFNNILGIIIGSIELLCLNSSGADEVTKKQTENIRTAAERAAKLTQQLLGFSRDHTTEIAVVDLNKTIHGMEEMIARSLTPSIKVVEQFANDLWPTDINTGDFQDVLINMILNGRDAMENDGTLTLETHNVHLDEDFCQQHSGAVPGDYVQLAVSDNGSGIPHKLQEKIFEPFFTTKKQGEGTGLGLAMAFGFVKRSNGFINLYSEPGVGTTFRLYLPRSLNKEVESNSPALQKTLPHGSETVLVVDDEELLVELAKSTLSTLGYTILTATDGHLALKELARHPEIGILITDVVMPGGINGYELANQATADNPDLKVLLCSGYTKKVLATKGYEHFSTNLLSKPYTQADLAQRVRAALDSLN